MKYQYISKKYPWHCDFYIPDKDIYIELQGYYTHGNHPFDINNKNDLEKLCDLKLKYLNFYKEKGYWPQPITIWTQKDVEKRKIAHKNHLNFIELYETNINKIIKILQNEKILD